MKKIINGIEIQLTSKEIAQRQLDEQQALIDKEIIDKRVAFYKKENYKIIYTENTNYTPNTSEWTVLYSPNNGTCKNEKEKETKNKISKSILEDTDNTPKDKYACGVCFLQIK
jgi:hypothetical protein